jgi:hypothetical protein
MSKLSLSDAIESIRSELIKAQLRGKGEEMRFEVVDIELELEIAGEVSKSTGFKASWWVVTGEVGTQSKESTRHKLKVKLNPIGIDGRSVKVSKELDSNPQVEELDQNPKSE